MGDCMTDKTDRRDPSQYREFVKITVRETLEAIGFDMRDPVEVQKDVAHMRKSRRMCDAIQAKSLAMFLTVLIPALLYGLWEALRHAVNRGGN